MTQAKRSTAAPAQAFPEAHATQPTPPAWARAADAAYEILLTAEPLALGASTVLGAAIPMGGKDRRQLERARLTLGALAPKAPIAAGLLDVAGWATFTDLGRARVEIENLLSAVEDALAALRAIDTFGELEGSGACAIHSDMILTVLQKQLREAEELLFKAMFLAFLCGCDIGTTSHQAETMREAA